MSLYRCSECRHGRNLSAYAQAVSSGRLGDDGQLETHDDVSDCFLFEGSIQCDVHPSAAVEKKLGSRFGRWLPCSECDGRGRRRDGYADVLCRGCAGEGSRWQLIDRVAA